MYFQLLYVIEANISNISIWYRIRIQIQWMRSEGKNSTKCMNKGFGSGVESKKKFQCCLMVAGRCTNAVWCVWYICMVSLLYVFGLVCACGLFCFLFSFVPVEWLEMFVIGELSWLVSFREGREQTQNGTRNSCKINFKNTNIKCINFTKNV